MSPMQILPGPRVRPHREPLTLIYHRFYARVGQSQQGTRKLSRSSHHFVGWVQATGHKPMSACGLRFALPTLHRAASLTLGRCRTLSELVLGPSDRVGASELAL